MVEVSPQPQLPIYCEGYLHPMAIHGLELFNAGLYWEAHEALEKAWREETSEIRDLYQGVLQVGVAYLHIQRCNYRGALKMYSRSKRWLEPFPETCRGIDLAQLRLDLETAIAEVRRLGPQRIDEFDPAHFKPILWVNSPPSR